MANELARVTWLQAAYWDKPSKWLAFLSLFFAVFASFYVILHHSTTLHKQYGWESIALDKENIQTLNAIFLTPSSAEPDSNKSSTARNNWLPSTETLTIAQQYIKNELGPIDQEQLKAVDEVLKYLPAQACVTYLLSQKFRVQSYFWLVGGQAYWEVILWSIFGVLSSSLFIVSSSLRIHADTGEEIFNVSDIPYQAVKLFYAPMCILILVFAYTLIQGDALADIEAGKGMLIFAFITGFYSGRMMTLLNRLKEVILPGSNFPDSKASSTQDANTDGLAVTVGFDSAIDPTITSQFEATDLGKTVLTLTSASGDAVGTFEKSNPDLPNEFHIQHVPEGTYQLTGTLKTEAGFNFSRSVPINLTEIVTSRVISLQLKPVQ